jgi:NAD(P)-dependent dehydrogenase (short-subunit alcohol dehydrogenase family)
MTTPLNELFGLTGKIAVVTGAAKGVGAGIARVLAEAGATVALADCDLEGAEQHAASLRDGGFEARAIGVDLADEGSVIAGCLSVVTEVGTPWLLVNNAAVQDRELLLETSSSEWDRIHAINARGAFLMTRELARAMVSAQRGGRIVNIASNGLRGGIVKGLAAYISSKGAMAALGLISAFELAEFGITVNTVLPGALITPGAINAKGPPTEGPATRTVPFGLQEPREIGAAVLYFASPIARSVTNQTLAVEGGFSIS